VIGEWPEATEAALLAEYHRDYIAEFWRGEISLRQLRVAIEGLPPGSAMHRAAGYTWGEIEHLIAGLVDVNNATFELLRAANSDENNNTYRPPELLPRPGASTPAEIAAADRHAAKKQERELAARRAAMQPLIDQLLPPNRAQLTP